MKFLKRIILFMLLCALGGFVIGCSHNKEKLSSALSETEIDHFLEEKRIESIAIEEVQDSTMVLHNRGIYYLSKNEDEITVNQSGWGGSNSDEKVQLGMTSTGSPHAYIIVQDKELLNKADKATVKFSDGTTATKQFGSTKGMLMFYDKSKHNLTINNELELSIYDHKGKVIYENNL
ncbi:hypothetical protein ACQ0QQ_13975 [Lysinibacillus sphaericus]